MSNKTLPNNTQGIENRLSNIDKELDKIREEEGELRIKIASVKLRRKRLIEERTKLRSSIRNIFNRDSKKRRITRQYGKGFVSPSKLTLRQKNNNGNK